MVETPRTGPDEILKAIRGDDPRAADRLLPLVYEELRGLAAAYIRRERPGHTLQPTALIHEAYLRLMGEKPIEWQDRAHFVAWTARLMRQILINHALNKKARKRKGEGERVPLDGLTILCDEQVLDVEALDEALGKLAAEDGRKARVVELRFFGGLSTAEVAEVLQISDTTVERDWRFARAWLHRALTGRRPAGRA